VAFARRGWRVGLIARGPEGLQAAAEEVRAAGGEAMTLEADVADASAVNQAADEAFEKFGGVDVWVNAAMATVIATAEDLSPEEFHRVTEVTYHGQVHGALAAVRLMRQSGGGVIVSVGSAMAYRGIPLQSAYCGAKFAVRGFLDSLRCELEHEGLPIKVSMVQLPAVNTPQFDWARNHEAKRPRPVAPVYQPEVIAEAIVKAAQTAPRELWVGRPTLQIIAGNAAAPSLLDKILARKGFKGQQTQEPAQERPDNLFEPVAGDFGAHGRFDGEAKDRLFSVDPAKLKAGLAAAALAIGAGAVGCAYLLGARRRFDGEAGDRVSGIDPGRLIAGVAAAAPAIGAGAVGYAHLKRRRSKRASRAAHSLETRAFDGGGHWPAAPWGDEEVAISQTPGLVPYSPIERHGVIGDRRTAAMVAADGAIDWLCLPDYDSPPLFGALIDIERGGFWRMGPARSGLGRQRYDNRTATVVTTWSGPEGVLELSDLMLWPQDERDPGRADRRVVLRRLRCTEGAAHASMELRPRDDFDAGAEVIGTSGGHRLQVGERQLGVWTSFPVTAEADALTARLSLREGEEAWAVLGLGEAAADWSVKRARKELEATERYWRKWAGSLIYYGPRRDHVIRSALTFQLLSYAPAGSIVAAPTTSLPERIGGSANWDYRYAWVRDASLVLAILGILGDVGTASRFMDWLVSLDSRNEMPLQVLYRIDGGLETPQSERPELSGYRGSKPVIVGNHAYEQKQIDSFGYLADCAHTYLEIAGPWKPEYLALIRRVADYTVQAWREPGNGIWELSEKRHYTTSKVMAWVTLDRAIKVAEKLGESVPDAWRTEKDAIHADVMENGWSEPLQAFREHYEADTLDASVLLIPLQGFLPADHPRVRATVQRIAQSLTIDGMVYRFDPKSLPSSAETPMGEREGAFLPCTFWMAAVYAQMGRVREAEAILSRVEAAAGELGLFSEGLDVRDGRLLGNSPLLLTHAAYVKAVAEVAKAVMPMGETAMDIGLKTEAAGRRIKRWAKGALAEPGIRPSWELRS
jgi:GH15 family glucan-1,4-alpha-glucosidase/NAD(P)-dependent dehydrogenase (short-subunit alcohol dehydrogenase family)